jgi:hypothetical protein
LPNPIQTAISSVAFFCLDLPFFCVHLSEDLDVQGLIGYQLLEPVVLCLLLPQAAGLADRHSAILIAPAVIDLLADPMRSARVTDLRPTALDLPKDADDLPYTLSVPHEFYGLYTAELSLNTLFCFSGLDHRKITIVKYSA